MKEKMRFLRGTLTGLTVCILCQLAGIANSSAAEKTESSSFHYYFDGLKFTIPTKGVFVIEKVAHHSVKDNCATHSNKDANTKSTCQSNANRLSSKQFVQQKDGVIVGGATERLIYKKGSEPLLSRLSLLITNKKGTIATKIDGADSQNLGGLIHALDRADGRQKHYRYDIHSDYYSLQSPPGLLSRRGFTILIKNADRMWHLDSETVKQWRNAGKLLENGRAIYLFAYGNNYKRALADFVNINGRIPMLPQWSLGTWFSRYQPYDEQDYKNIIAGFRNRQIPLDVIVPDMNWHKDNWFSTEYNTERFPEMKEFLKWCHQQNIHVGFNHHPGAVPVADARAKAFLQEIGLSQKKALAETAHVVNDLGWTDAVGTYYFGEDNVDYLRRYFDRFIHPLMADGVDFNWVDGSPSQPVLRAYYELTEQANNRRAIVLTRMVAGSFEMHRYPLAFSGDTYISWQSLAFTLLQSLHGANQGVVWSHDIGGHMAKTDSANAELFARWIQLGAMLPVTRLHATGGTEWDNRLIHDRRIWTWGDKVTNSARKILQLKNQLKPYWYTLQREAFETGVIATRPLYFNYPDSIKAYQFADSEYLIGDSLLVAPILSSSPGGKGIDGLGKREVWLPKGNWYDWFSGKKYKGDQVIVIEKSIDEMPLFVKAGSVIPMRSLSATAMNNRQPLTLRIFPAEKQKLAHTRVYIDDGVTLNYRKEDYQDFEISVTNLQNKLTLEITCSGSCSRENTLDPDKVGIDFVTENRQN